MEQKKRKTIIEKSYDFFLCLYILLAPINNLLNRLGIYATVVMIAAGTIGTGCAVWLILRDNSNKSRFGRYGIFWVLALLLTQAGLALIIGPQINYLVFLPILCFCVFVACPTRMPLHRLYSMVYWSTIFSAIGSVSFGFIGGSVERTAVLVDGSIAPICLAVVLFARENFQKTDKYNLLKFFAAIACVLVAAFGMSRSRLLLMLLLLVLKFLVAAKNILLRGRVSVFTLLMIPIGLLAILVVSRTALFQNLTSAITLRFNDGLTDAGRDNEIQMAWQWFKENWFWGVGWGDLVHMGWQYYNHNAYMAILARGGLVMALAVGSHYLQITGAVLKSKNMLCVVLLGLFFFLSYGNAGFFNYTISGAFILLMANLVSTGESKQNSNTQVKKGD